MIGLNGMPNVSVVWIYFEVYLSALDLDRCFQQCSPTMDGHWMLDTSTIRLIKTATNQLDRYLYYKRLEAFVRCHVQPAVHRVLMIFFVFLHLSEINACKRSTMSWPWWREAMLEQRFARDARATTGLLKCIIKIAHACQNADIGWEPIVTGGK